MKYFAFVYAATKVVPGGPILNNGTQSPEEKLIVWRPKNPEKYLIKARMNVFVETKTNEGKEIYENILGKEILS